MYSLKPTFDLTFWQTLYYLKLEKFQLNENAQRVFGKIKHKRKGLTESNIDLEFDCFSLDLDQRTKPSKGSFYSIQLQGLLKIFNTEEAFDEFLGKMESEDNLEVVRAMDPELFEELAKPPKKEEKEVLRNNSVYYYLPIYVNLKTFQFRFSFFEFAYSANYRDLLKSFPENQSVPESLDIEFEELSHLNSLCLNSGQCVFYDSVSEPSTSSRILVTYLLDEFYASSLASTMEADFDLPLLLAKSAFTIDFSSKQCQYDPVQPTKKKLSLAEVMKKKAIPLVLRNFSLTIRKQIPVKKLIKTSQKLLPLNLKEFLSKENLIEEQSNLNIKLMKWRLEPSLQLKPIQNLKVLMVGSGTLGCNMGRLLSAWGIRHLGFIDYGTVSYSNLTRQSLFTLNDFNVQGEGLGKAEAAVKNMKLLIPSIDAKAYQFKIPMPGHSCSEDMLEKEFENLQKLEELIKEYDVVFNVLDSREARYFPTVFSGIYNKVCISVGLGYDNFVIVKHGYRDFKKLLTKGTSLL